MVKFGVFLAALAALSAAPCAAAPLELYGRLPNIEAVAISPDGNKLGVILTDGEQRKILIEDLTDRKRDRLLGVGAAKVRDLDWAGPDHLIITTSRTAIIQDVIAPRAEYFMAFDYNLACSGYVYGLMMA
ncbi:MAG: S9 family peptidase, partial [Phenylobacterium sp.]